MQKLSNFRNWAALVGGLVFAALIAPIQAQAYVQNALCVSGDATLCPTLPVDMPDLGVDPGYVPNTNAGANGGTHDAASQTEFDYFGWQMFVALNWPADETGAPAGHIMDDPSAPRVWETYATVDDVFGGNAKGVEGCSAAQGAMTLSQTSKITTSSFTEPFTSSPLIDAAGNFVLYDIRMNSREVAYLMTNGLTTKAGQATFKAAHPEGWNLPKGLGTTPGAMEIKTAWRILPDGANPMGYYTTVATVMVPAQNSDTGQALCLNVTVGLVSMHIMQKITNPDKFSDFWVWATFEHSQNAPDAAGALPSARDDSAASQGTDPVASCPAPTDTTASYAFFNAACTDGGAACIPNAEPDLGGKPILWAANAPYGAKYLMDGKYGTQVTRCWAVYDSAKSVDTVFQTALAGSVWANYQMIGVQWAIDHVVEFPEPLMPFPAPVYMVNSTLETYLQIKPVINPKTGKANQGASGSCIICHDTATDTAGSKSDFSFLGFYAQ